MSERQIVLDTETTGIGEDHRIIEIGCIELVNRRPTENRFHHYVNPERDIDAGALQVHGITRAFLSEKPKFAEIAESLVEYLRGAEVIIHNAEFDVGFLNAELERAGFRERIETLCTVTDSLLLARKMHPGQRNGLDALCQRYSIDTTQRDLHGALLDARLLAGVYLAMTGGQATLSLDSVADTATPGAVTVDVAHETGPLVVVQADAAELEAHRARLEAIQKKAGALLWNTDLAA